MGFEYIFFCGAYTVNAIYNLASFGRAYGMILASDLHAECFKPAGVQAWAKLN